jgi:endonuclease III-like uncharacterized protein
MHDTITIDNLLLYKCWSLEFVVDDVKKRFLAQHILLLLSLTREIEEVIASALTNLIVIYTLSFILFLLSSLTFLFMLNHSSYLKY